MAFISLLILLFIFNFSISSNLFFKWRITDIEKAQFKEEALSLLKSNMQLYEGIISNFKEKYNNIQMPKNSNISKDNEEDEPNLYLSRYTHCQKCKTFLKNIKLMKEKYGFQNFYDNFKSVACILVDGFDLIAADACRSLIDKYGPYLIENIFMRHINSYYLCEKLDLCPAEIPKKFIDPELYAKRVIEGKPNKKKEKIKENGKKLKILQITDVHLDLFYEQNASAKCNYPICCRNNSNSTIKDNDDNGDLCGKYGYEGKADLSLELFDSFIEDVSKRDIDFIIYTGDNAPHDVWSINQSSVYYVSEFIRDRLNNKFRNGNKNIPIYYSIGNHEKFPVDGFRDNETDFLQKYADIYKDYLNESAYKDFKDKGSYSMLYGSNLRIISINCLVCDSFNFNLINSTKKHVKDMFVWLEEQLKDAEKKNEFVYILNHFPLNGEFTWPECGKRFQALFDRYEYNIRGIFSGHTHRDDIEGITEYFNKSKIIHLNFVAPQLTTYSYKLPSYRIYTADDETKQIIDYEQFRFDLTKSNEEEKPYWNSAYNASNLYKVNNMLEYDKIINFDNMSEYVFHQLSGAKAGEKNRNNPDRQKSAKCIMTTNNFYEYFQCYSPEISLKSDFLVLLVNFLIGPFEE